MPQCLWVYTPVNLLVNQPWVWNDPEMQDEGCRQKGSGVCVRFLKKLSSQERSDYFLSFLKAPHPECIREVLHRIRIHGTFKFKYFRTSDGQWYALEFQLFLKDRNKSFTSTPSYREQETEAHRRKMTSPSTAIYITGRLRWRIRLFSPSLPLQKRRLKDYQNFF